MLTKEHSSLVENISIYLLEGFNHLSVRSYLGQQDETSALLAMLQDDEATAKSILPNRVTHYLQQDQREQDLRRKSSHTLGYFKSESWYVTLDRPISTEAYSSKSLPSSLAHRLKSVLKINRFDQSRLMYLYHDLIDHLFFFDFCEKEGLFDQFATLFKQGDPPAQSDLFCRFSEHISGVSYAIRHFALNPLRPLPSHEPSILKEYLRAHCEQLDHIPDLDVPHIFDQLDHPERAPWISSVVYDVVSQITDERRSWGCAKSPQTGVPITLIQPEYIAFIVTCALRYLDERLPILDWAIRVACWTQLIWDELKFTPQLNFTYQDVCAYDPMSCAEYDGLKQNLRLMTRYSD